MLKFRVSGSRIDLEILSKTLQKMDIVQGNISKFYIDRNQSGKGDFAQGRIYFDVEVAFLQQYIQQKGEYNGKSNE